MNMKPRLPKSLIRMPKRKPQVKIQAAATRSRRNVAEVPEEEYDEESEPNMRLSHAFIVVLILHLVAVAGVFGFNAIKSRQTSLAKLEAEAAAAAANPVQAAAGNALADGLPEAIGSTPARPQQEAGNVLPPVTAPGESVYEVVAGDTLTRIASRQGTTVEQLMTANNLGDDAVIRVGQKLIISAPGTAARASTPPVTPVVNSTPVAPSKPAPAPETSASSAPVAGDGTYEVVQGDNPYSIAKKLGVSYQELLEVNGIDDPTKLQIGQKLKVPAAN